MNRRKLFFRTIFKSEKHFILQIYSAWQPLYDVYVNNPLDYGNYFFYFSKSKKRRGNDSS